MNVYKELFENRDKLKYPYSIKYIPIKITKKHKEKWWMRKSTFHTYTQKTNSWD